MIKFLDLKKQYLGIKSEVDDAIFSVIDDCAFIGGKHVHEFEDNFAEYQQAKYCVGVGNGTDALEIAIESLELDKGSEIIVPANSFIASSEAVTRAGYKVVFCDCDPDDYTISIEGVKNSITPNTSAIMAVHLYGHPCDMDALLAISRQYNLKIIEDCAQAHSAEYKGKRVGAIGDIGAFSFYPGKNLGAYGDGGAILTNNSELAEKCRMIANHGRIDKYDHIFEGRNSRLDGLQAAILNVKLKYLDKWIERRIELAQYYSEGLSAEGLYALPVKKEWAKHVYHLFVIRVNNRNELKKVLYESGVESGVHYPISLPKLKAYQYTNQYDNSFVANEYDQLILSLPIGDHLSIKDIDKVIDIVNIHYK